VSPTPGAALELEDVHVAYGRAQVLGGVTLRLAAGETAALLGPSGSGKTTLMRVVLGLTPPDRGRVRIGGEIDSADGRVIRSPEDRGLAVVFQDLALWPHMTVAQNLAFGLEARAVPAAEIRSRVGGMLERVGLGELSARYPAQLSGGERQRVAIARALVLEPRAVLFDEPLTSLDVLLRRELLALLRSLLSERGTTALYITHDPREAVQVARRLAILAHGRIVAIGDLDELRRDPQDGYVRALLSELTDCTSRACSDAR